MSSSALFSILELLGFFVIAAGLGFHQLWALKKLELARLQRENAKAERQAAG